ncbi:MAG: hypothetical protein ACI4MN_01745 [Candidatus Coproplasma sp.]
MQLAILIAMLMLISQNNFTQLKPLIEELGGDEAKSAIKQAEELNQIISTVKTLTSAQPLQGKQSEYGEPVTAEQSFIVSRPLEPIKNIADEKTLSALSRYVALGE